jgi:putative ABC transport system permease protein
VILRDQIARSGRNLRNAKARTLLTAAAIAVGTFALTLTLAASNGATAFVNKIIAENFDPAELIVAKDKSIFGGNGSNTNPREYDPSFGTGVSNSGATTQIKRVTDEDIAVIKSVDGVVNVREDITVNLRYITRPDQKKYVASLAAFSPAQKPTLLAGNIGEGGVVGKDAILLPEGYVKALGFKDAQDAIGKDITASVTKSLTAGAADITSLRADVSSPADLAKLSEQASVERTLKVAAVTKKPTTAQPGTELYLYADADTARELNDITTEGTANYRKYNYVFAKVEGGENEATLKAAQDELKKKGFAVQSVKEAQEFLTSIISILQGIVAAFAAIAIIASVFGIVNTMYISVLQRTREIGLMKALGMRKRDIGRLFRFEAAWIGFIGGVVGSLLAVGLGVALNPWITKSLDLGTGNSLLIFKPFEVVQLVVALMIVAILAGWLPSRKAAKLDPIEALRTE